MISVPIDLDNSSPASVLEDDLGSYDDTQWRLLRYINGNNVEFHRNQLPVQLRLQSKLHYLLCQLYKAMNGFCNSLRKATAFWIKTITLGF